MTHDDRDHVLREEDEAVAEEEPDRLQVDGGPGHQLARLVPVEVSEGEAEQMRVERVPHVPLDPERLVAGDEPAAEHEQRTQQPDGQDRDDEVGEHVPVLAAAELVDHLSREDDDRDRGALREDREHRRDGEREPIRAQERQQAGERSRVGDGHRPMVGTGSVLAAIRPAASLRTHSCFHDRNRERR